MAINGYKFFMAAKKFRGWLRLNDFVAVASGSWRQLGGLLLIEIQELEWFMHLCNRNKLNLLSLEIILTEAEFMVRRQNSTSAEEVARFDIWSPKTRSNIPMDRQLPYGDFLEFTIWRRNSTSAEEVARFQRLSSKFEISITQFWSIDSIRDFQYENLILTPSIQINRDGRYQKQRSCNPCSN